MERLTQRSAKGMAYYPRCVNECEKENCRFCPYETVIAERIASYEDLGVTPEQIREMDKAYLEKCEEINRLKAELKEYEHMEHALMEMYGEGANLKVFVKLLIGAVGAKQKIEAAGGEIKKMVILTNETADEWEAYKKMREKCEEEKKHGT